MNRVCKTCGGSGGLNIEHDWGIQFEPCPDSHCTFDQEKAQKEIFDTLDRLIKEMDDAA